MIRRNGPKLAIGLLLLTALVGLHVLTSLPNAPDIALETAASRERFPLDVALPDLQGKTVHLTDLRGKVVLINFWATWCYPCRAEMPSMHALYQNYRDKGFEILAISIDVQGKDVVAPFVDAYGLTFPILLDPGDVVSTRLQIRGIPTSYLLDKHGRIASVEIGIRDWNSTNMRRFLDGLLAEEGINDLSQVDR
jgi:thiol-disulfide isomerase/thioredoxin